MAAFYFAYFCYLGVYAPYFSLYLAGEGFAAGEIALILALPQFARIFAPMGWGWLSDATGSRRGVVALSCGLTTAAVGMLSLVSGFLPTALTVGLIGVCSAAILSIVDALAFSVLAPHTHRYGPVRLWGSVGFILAVLATGAMLDVLPVARLRWVLFGVSLASFLIAFQLPALPVEHAVQVKGSLRAVLRRPEVIAFFVACTCMTVAHGALYAFYSIYLVAHEYSKSVVGILWMLGVLAEILVFVAMPVLVRRFSLRAILLASFVAAGVRFAAIGWGVDWLAVLVAAQLLHAATFGSFHAASLAVVHRAFAGPLQVRGQALYMSLCYGLGGVAGTLLAGATWVPLGSAATFGISALFGLAGAAIVAWRVRV
ncbi:MAG: MFS transporter [Proteobacteria bacterium]|nr:MFS transporter [Pseudomonadota bacterium]